MNWFVVLLVFSLSLSANSEDIGDILELDQRKLTSDRSHSGYRSFHSDPDFNRNTDDNQQKLNLKQFLETYAKKHTKNHQDEENLDQLNQENVKQNSKDKSISQWTLLDLQRNKHPFDERKGWVSLEPIPWSVSKISKWQSKYKPSSERPWDVHGPISSSRPYEDDDLEFNRPISITPPNPYVYHRPTESSDRYDTFHDRPRPTTASSIYPRPTAYFGNKIHVETHFPSNSFSSTVKPYNYHKEKDRNHPYDEIITDGQPSNFPTQSNQYDSFRRKGTEMEIPTGTHPFNGEGEWVLLSTTKGYKPQRNRQRSLQIDSTSEPASQILRASRGVRLTVLPPLKGSNVNMTTSHGGLLQVESTFESVEQAKQKFDKKARKTKRKRRKSTKNSGKQEVAPQYGDPEAVMAAVGAGMIPATMAMMVPIAMTG